jgi:hypothetical protein
MMNRRKPASSRFQAWGIRWITSISDAHQASSRLVLVMAGFL